MKDIFGLVGFILRLITIIILIISSVIATSVSFYISELTDGTTSASSPNIAWSVDAANDRITITMCSPSRTKYADSSYN